MGIFSFFKKARETMREINEEIKKEDAFKEFVFSIGDDLYEVDEKNPYAGTFKEVPLFKMEEPTEEFLKSLARKPDKEVDYWKFIKHSGTTKDPECYIVFDLETTGLEAHKEAITEIAAIKFDYDEPVEYFHTYVNPKKKIREKITDLTGITNEMVASAPPIEYVLPNFLKFIDKYTLISHNVSFDMSFILDPMYNLGYKKPGNKAIDTLALARRFMKDEDTGKRLSSYKLEDLKYQLGLPLDVYDIKSHNALYDTKVAYFLYKNCRELKDEYYKYK